MSGQVNINQLNQRLTQVESTMGFKGLGGPKEGSSATPISSAGSSFLSTVESFFSEEKQKVVTEVKTLWNSEITKLGLTPNNICGIINFAVDFVEKLVTVIPKIVQVVGGVFSGQFKLSMAIELIKEIIPNIESILPSGLLPQLVNHTVSLKFNKDGTKTTNISKSSHVETNITLPSVASDRPLAGSERPAFGRERANEQANQPQSSSSIKSSKKKPLCAVV